MLNDFFSSPALLGAASQRVEFLLLEWFGNEWIHSLLEEWKKHERGALPGIAEAACMIYIVSLIWGELRSLYADGLIEYISDLWNSKRKSPPHPHKVS